MARTYNNDQIDRYFDRIGLTRPTGEPSLEMLKTIQMYQLSAVPFETLALHYSTDYKISIDPEDVYEKIVVRRRGGYCMENNTLFSIVLRSIGFEIYSTGARVKRRVNDVPQVDYLGWTHMVNIVTLPSGGQYMVDVGFGGDGPIQPINLVSGACLKNIGTQEMRLDNEAITSTVDRRQKVWRYQIRNKVNGPWLELYCFTEIEFLKEDFDVINYWTSTHPQSFITWRIVVARMLRNEKGIYGKVILVNGELKQREGTESKVLRICETEDERLKVLETHFGIVLGEKERSGIFRRVTELPGK